MECTQVVVVGGVVWGVGLQQLDCWDRGFGSRQRNWCCSLVRRLRKTAKSDYELRHDFLSVRPPVRMEQLGSHWTDFHEIWYLFILRKIIEKIQVSLKSYKNSGYFTWRPIEQRVLYMKTDRITGTLLEDLFTFVITSLWILRRMRNVSGKFYRENQKALLCTVTFFPENGAF